MTSGSSASDLDLGLEAAAPVASVAFRFPWMASFPVIYSSMYKRTFASEIIKRSTSFAQHGSTMSPSLMELGSF